MRQACLYARQDMHIIINFARHDMHFLINHNLQFLILNSAQVANVCVSLRVCARERTI